MVFVFGKGMARGTEDFQGREIWRTRLLACAEDVAGDEDGLEDVGFFKLGVAGGFGEGEEAGGAGVDGDAGGGFGSEQVGEGEFEEVALGGAAVWYSAERVSSTVTPFWSGWMGMDCRLPHSRVFLVRVSQPRPSKAVAAQAQSKWGLVCDDGGAT